MKRHTFLVLAVLVPSIVLASGERAGADLITFEVIPDVTALGTFFDGTPVPVEARLSDQLRSQGVSFSSTAGYVALVNLGGGHATSGVNGIGGVNAAGALKYNSRWSSRSRYPAIPAPRPSRISFPFEATTSPPPAALPRWRPSTSMGSCWRA